MKTLVVGVGAFGFAILKHLGNKHPNEKIYAYENADFVSGYLKNFKRHPYLYEGVKLSKNIEFIENPNKILKSIDLLIITIPCQNVLPFLREIKSLFKPGLTILNLSKGINNTSLNTIGDDIAILLKGISYNYASLSGGMISSDLVKGEIIGGSLGTESELLGLKLKEYFETQKFKIQLYTGRVKNTELAGALKNVFVLFTGYLEGKGFGASSIGCFFCDYYLEYKNLFGFLGGNTEDISFDKYAIGGDLIASSFGSSRNRYFGKLIGEGKKLNEVLEIMKNERKTTEGYETLKGLYKIIKDNKDFPITKEYGEKILFAN